MNIFSSIQTHKKTIFVAITATVLLASGCSQQSETSDSTAVVVAEPTTTTTLPAPTTTTTVAQTDTGFEYVPHAVGDCQTDLDSLEDVMAIYPLDEMEEGHIDAFNLLLESAVKECRTDVMERWVFETYQPWLQGAPIEKGVVSIDVNEWPEEWRNQRSTNTSDTTTEPSPGDDAAVEDDQTAGEENANTSDDESADEEQTNTQPADGNNEEDAEGDSSGGNTEPSGDE